MSEAKTLVDHNYTGIIRQFQAHVQHGWEIDPSNPPDIWGVAYEVHIVRNDKTLAAMASRVPGAEPKMSREETLRIAREAKAAKRAQTGQANGD
jgi:hypothetical protein